MNNKHYFTWLEAHKRHANTTVPLKKNAHLLYHTCGRKKCEEKITSITLSPVTCSIRQNASPIYLTHFFLFLLCLAMSVLTPVHPSLHIFCYSCQSENPRQSGDVLQERQRHQSHMHIGDGQPGTAVVHLLVQGWLSDKLLAAWRHQCAD